MTPTESKKTTKSKYEKTSVRSRVLAWFDRMRESLAAERIRQASKELERKIGLTRSGQISVLAFVLLWLPEPLFTSWLTVAFSL